MGFNKNLIILLCFLFHLPISYELDNGLALTPPMGWLAWERFKCNTDCEFSDEHCISEKLFMRMADRLVSDGYRDAGYKYVNIDDCWQSEERDSNGNMVADPKRFPHGIKFLSDYMHERGLLLGIYQDFGTKTCMGYPGIVGHMQQDADAFAKWNVDMVKLDGCHSHPSDMDEGYIQMGEWLNNTKKPMLYSCSWPYYQLINQMEPNYELISTHCNMWRSFHDIQDSWKSIQFIMDFFGDNQEVWAPYIGPGHWNDPDMLTIGNFHLTPAQARIQMAVWCILPAPLLMSNDLRAMKVGTKEILLNKWAIKVNQDPLGKPGKRIFKKNNIEIWRRPIMPQNVRGETSFAILFVNTIMSKNVISIHLKELGLNSEPGYVIHNVFGDADYGFFPPNQTLVPHGLFLPNQTLVVPLDRQDVIFLYCKLVCVFCT